MGTLLYPVTAWGMPVLSTAGDKSLGLLAWDSAKVGTGSPHRDSVWGRMSGELKDLSDITCKAKGHILCYSLQLLEKAPKLGCDFLKVLIGKVTNYINELNAFFIVLNTIFQLELYWA